MATTTTPPAASSAPEAARRIPEITWLKGFAILCVLLIHACPLNGTLVFSELVNRAVPIFIVLFGLTSEKWWSAQRATETAILKEWFGTRFLRIMIPVWGMLPFWWAMVLWSPNLEYKWWHFLATVAGYAPWIGTAWFISMVLELVVLFPAIRYLTDRAGLPIALALGALVSGLSEVNAFPIIDFLRVLFLNSAPGDGFYYFWIFAPAKFFHVIAGIALARNLHRVTRQQRWLLAGILVLGSLAIPRVPDPHWANAGRSLLDVPLTIVLLQAFSVFRRLPTPARALAWCGESSWGLYLGQMIMHNALPPLVGPPERMAVGSRWAYFFALLVGAIGLVLAGDKVRALRWLPSNRRLPSRTGP